MMTSELKEEHKDLDDFELVPESDCVWLWGYGRWPERSVLSGQFKQARLDCFDTLEQAQAKYPNVKVRDDETVNFPSWMVNSVSDTPPADFDPSYAGETW